jgi:hypothetical protein
MPEKISLDDILETLAQKNESVSQTQAPRLK